MKSKTEFFKRASEVVGAAVVVGVVAKFGEAPAKIPIGSFGAGIMARMKENSTIKTSTHSSDTIEDSSIKNRN